jgi:hypothetical protein
MQFFFPTSFPVLFRLGIFFYTRLGNFGRIRTFQCMAEKEKGGGSVGFFYSFWLDFSLQEKYVKRIVLGTRVQEKEKGRGGRGSWEGGGRIGRRERGSEARRGMREAHVTGRWGGGWQARSTATGPDRMRLSLGASASLLHGIGVLPCIFERYILG